MVKTVLKKIGLWFYQWNEFITVPIVIVAYVFLTPIVRWLDPSAASYDGGYFLKPFMVIVHFLIYHIAAWFTFKLTWPRAFKWIDRQLEDDFAPNTSQDKNLTVWQKTLVVLSLFFVYFLGIILVSLGV